MAGAFRTVKGRCIKGLVSFAVEPAEVRGHDLELYHLRIISFSLGLEVQETAPTEYGRVSYDTDPRWHWPIKWAQVCRREGIVGAQKRVQEAWGEGDPCQMGRRW